MGDDHIINFDYPGWDEGRLGDIARRITKEYATERSPEPRHLAGAAEVESLVAFWEGEH